MKKMVFKWKKDGEDHTSRWDIGRFYCDCWLLSSGLKLYKIKLLD
jgi:hypothetical protein